MKKILQGLLILTLFTSVPFYGNGGSCGCCNSCNTCCNSCCNGNCNCGCDCNCDCCDSCLCPCDGYPFLLTRSQGRNAARELVGWQQFINKYGTENYYGSFYVGLEYTRTFRPWYINNFLFGCDLDCCNALLIQGSQVENRNAKAWLADYFGLSPAFDSQVSFCPKIQNVILDLNWFVGLDKWKKGVFLRIDMPIAWTQWELNMCETIKDDGGIVGFDAGYMHQDVVNRNQLPDNFTQAMSGTITFGDMKEAIKFGRMTNCQLTKAGIADLRVTFGYNMVLKEDGHFGLFAHLTAPTGSSPNAYFLFEPIIGNGKHWELGIGFTSSWIFHRCTDDDSRYLGFWLDATISHLFKSTQCRSFDFKCKPNSRYMLLEQMTTGDGNLTGQPADYTVSDYQYAGNLIPAINWSTFCVDVKINAQADIVLKFGHVRENWNFDLGYNLWARTGETFCSDCCCNNTCGTYAIKGDAKLYGKYGQAETVVALGETQNCATIYGPANNADGFSIIDNEQNAYYTDSGNNLVTYLTTGSAATSIQPILIDQCMLNMCKSPSAITHKLFAHMGYAWKETDDRWVPFLGLGAEVEFAQRACCNGDCGCGCGCNGGSCGCNSCCTTCNSCTSCNSCCDSCCNSCCDDCCCPKKRAGVYQWGLWLKGGVSFD